MIEDKRLVLKEKVLIFLSEFPFYKWAAKSVGRDEDTLILWRNEDKDFSERCEIAKSEAMKRLGRRATPDFMLKNADPETFKDKKEMEVSGDPLVIIKSDGDTTKSMADTNMG